MHGILRGAGARLWAPVYRDACGPLSQAKKGIDGAGLSRHEKDFLQQHRKKYCVGEKAVAY
jgi:hypothetical protein